MTEPSKCLKLSVCWVGGRCLFSQDHAGTRRKTQQFLKAGNLLGLLAPSPGWKVIKALLLLVKLSAFGT